MPLLSNRRVQLGVALAVGALMVLATWAVPRPIGDLYVAYAAGEDIVAGELFGQTDTWSFNTEGQIWFDQNWGTHLLYYGTRVLAGPTGILVLKMLLLLVGAAAMTLAARQYGTDWALAILIASTALLCGHAYIDLRPNLITLMFAPVMLWLLHRCKADPRKRIWLAVGFIAVWANMHGGFMLGLGMISLWALTQSLAVGLPLLVGTDPQRREQFRQRARSLVWLWAAVVAAFLAAMLLTPYVIKNLTHPLVVANSETWREVLEWRPVYDLVPVRVTPGGQLFETSLVHYGSTWEFLSMLVILPAAAITILLRRKMPQPAQAILIIGTWGAAALLVFQFGYFTHATTKVLYAIAESLGLIDPLERNYHMLGQGPRSAVAMFAGLALLGGAGLAGWRCVVWLLRGQGSKVFDLLLGTVVVLMAFKARRFVPLAVILVAPMLAWQLQQVLASLRLRWLIPAAALVLLWPTGSMLIDQYWYYQPQNPTVNERADTVYRKMIHYNQYSPEGVEFMRHNGLTGRVFQEWRWEGFLRWRLDDQIQTFVGGRAQQVHPLEDYKVRKEILSIYDKQLVNGGWARGENLALRHLDYLDVDYVFMPVSSSAELPSVLMQGTLSTPPQWLPVFWTEDSYILARRDHARPNELIRRVATNDPNLWWPDERIKTLTRAMLLSTLANRPEQARAALEQIKKAMVIRPDIWGYYQVARLLEENLLTTAEAEAFLAGELERLRRRADQAEQTGDQRQTLYLLGGIGAVAHQLSWLYANQARALQDNYERLSLEQKQELERLAKLVELTERAKAEAGKRAREIEQAWQ